MLNIATALFGLLTVLCQVSAIQDCPLITCNNGRIKSSHSLDNATIMTSYGDFNKQCPSLCPGLYFGALQVSTSDNCTTQLFCNLDHCTLENSAVLPTCRAHFEPFLRIIITILTLLILALIAYVTYLLRNTSFGRFFGIFHRAIAGICLSRSNDLTVEDVPATSFESIPRNNTPVIPGLVHSNTQDITPDSQEDNPDHLQRPRISMFSLSPTTSSATSSPYATPEGSPMPIRAHTGNNVFHIRFPPPYACLLLLLICVPANSYACDETLIQQSSSVLCNSTNWVDMHSVQIRLFQGMTVCFTSLHNVSSSLTLDRVRLVTTAKYSYHTAKYVTFSEVLESCSGSVWYQCNTYACKKDKAHRSAAPPTNTFLRKESCLMVPQTFGDGCWYLEKCTSSTLFLAVDQKSSLIPIYKLITETHRYEFSLTTSNATRKIILTDNSAHPDLLILGSSGMQYDLMPFFFITDHTAFNVDAAPVHLPILGKLGEFQVIKSQLFFPLHRINRYPAGTNPGWELPPQVFDDTIDNPKFRASLLTFEASHVLPSQSSITLEKPIDRAVSVLMKSPDILREIFETPECDIKFTAGISCSSCDLPTTFEITTSNTKKVGKLYFESNCELSSNMVECKPQPYRNIIVCINCPLPCEIFILGQKEPILTMNVQELDFGPAISDLHNSPSTVDINDYFTAYKKPALYSFLQSCIGGIAIFTLVKLGALAYIIQRVNGCLRPSTRRG